MDRRKFLIATGTVATGAWVAPQVYSAQAQTSGGTPEPTTTLPPPTPTCTGTAWDTLGVFGGAISGQVGPANQSPVDTDSNETCITSISIDYPNQPKESGGATIATFNQGPLITISTDCVDNDFPSGGPCTSEVSLTEVFINLSKLIGRKFEITATLLEASATASCSGFTTTGQVVGLKVNSTSYANTSSQTTITLPSSVQSGLAAAGLSATVVLNEVLTSPNTIERNAIHISITGSQTLDLTVAHAEADIHGC